MKKLILIVFATMCFSSGVALNLQTGTDETVRKFYAWYLGRLNKDDMTPLKNRTVALQYLTPEYLKAVPRLTRESDSDVIICAQDFDSLWEKNIKVDAPTIDGARATNYVNLVGKEVGTVKMKVTLKRLAAGWRIDGVECAD